MLRFSQQIVQTNLSFLYVHVSICLSFIQLLLPQAGPILESHWTLNYTHGVSDGHENDIRSWTIDHARQGICLHFVHTLRLCEVKM